jgi:hypothetical protein
LKIQKSVPFDLHVLGTPPAFILSQDQTLQMSWAIGKANLPCLVILKSGSQNTDLVFILKVVASGDRE